MTQYTKVDIKMSTYYCQECGAKNDIDDIECIVCGAVSKTLNAPFDRSEKLKLFFYMTSIIYIVLPFFLLKIPMTIFIIITWFVIMTPIFIIIIRSLYITYKEKSFKPIEKSKDYIQIYFKILTYVNFIFFGLLFVLLLASGGNTDDFGVALIATFTVVIVQMLIRLLTYKIWFEILETHKKWIADNGIFSNIPSRTSDRSIDTIERDRFNSSSLADELLKWKAMLDDGIIDQDEFDKVKRKLFNSENQ